MTIEAGALSGHVLNAPFLHNGCPLFSAFSLI
jgi:hypothetical protein